MERIRRSFRRSKNKNKEIEEDKKDDHLDDLDLGLGFEGSSTIGRAAAPTRMERIRQSLRFKKRKDKSREEGKEDDQPVPIEDNITEEPFDKKSKFRKSLKFRRKKKSKKSGKFETDEESVRAGRCSFRVKYLGSTEVQDSRGMDVCEAAIKMLMKGKKKPISAALHVSGDGLRLVEKDTSGMLVDQVIEKVSFCSPDRNHDRGFAYICRDGTTKRWLCHCFLAKEDTGERLSHAVGVAFAICLERKQQREADCGVTMNYNEADGTFTRFGSFRQGTITERIMDPQTFKPSSPPPVSKVDNPHAVARPHASDLMYQRQASFKGLANLSGNSPFKRTAAAYSSLRETVLPSNIQRKEKSRISLILEENIPEDDEPLGGLYKKPVSSVAPSSPMLTLAGDLGGDNRGDANNSSNSSQQGEGGIANVGWTNNGALPSSAAFINSTPAIVHQPPVFSWSQSNSLNNNNNHHTDSKPQTALSEPKIEPKQVARVPPVPQQLQLQQQSVPAVTTQQPVQLSQTTAASVESTGESNNPWDHVPDQMKLKQHSRSNSKTETLSKENPADSWLASLTSKIAVLEERNASLGFQSPTEKKDDELDMEFAAIASRNARSKNTNPFKAAV